MTSSPTGAWSIAARIWGVGIVTLSQLHWSTLYYATKPVSLLKSMIRVGNRYFVSMTAWADREEPDTLVLFDVDGTLTPARLVIH
jgi:hypothetical protein